MQMDKALAILSRTVKYFLPPVCLLFLCLGTAVGWSNGPFDEHKSVRSSMSPSLKVTDLLHGVYCKSSVTQMISRAAVVWGLFCFPGQPKAMWGLLSSAKAMVRNIRDCACNISLFFSSLFVSSLMRKRLSYKNDKDKLPIIFTKQFPVPQGTWLWELKEGVHYFLNAKLSGVDQRPLVLWLNTCLWVWQGVRSVHT